MSTSIKKITLFGICCGFILLICIFILVNNHLIRVSFTRFELDCLADDINRTQNTLADEIKTLNTTVTDWAVWDDSHAFMKKPSASYIKSNLLDKALNALNLECILFINNDKTIAFAKYRKDADSFSHDVPAELLDMILRTANIPETTTQEHKTSGFYYLHDKLLVIASCPILTSEGKGPKSGTLVMGRLMTRDALHTIATKIKIKFTLDERTAPLGGAFNTIKTTFEDEYGNTIYVYDIDANEIAAATSMKDIVKHETLRLIVYNNKDITNRGYAILWESSLILLIGGLVLLYFMVFFIDKNVIKRILSLTTQLASIAKRYDQNDTRECVTISGNDELHLLSQQINFFIAESYDYKNKLEQLVTEKVIDLHNDIIKYQKTIADLRIENSSIVKDNKAKYDFFAKTTHELRTPLNAIKGMSDFLLGTPLDTEQQDCAATIQQASLHLTKIVDDILELSKIDAAKMALEQLDFNLFNLVESSTKMLKPFADQKHLQFAFFFNGDREGVVASDPSRIRQILFNLIYNAIKFTHAGSVSVIVTLQDKPESDLLDIEIIIRDTGIGMSKETIRSLFSPFVQGTSAITREYGGTGLGLAICKKLVELLGGTIAVQSQIDRGSEFTVHLEAARGNADSLSEPYGFVPSNELDTFRILIVDDNLINLKVATKLFSLLYQKPICIPSSQEALELLKKEPFDIIFTDIEMPDINGYALTKSIRASGPLHPNKDTPIIAMTAYSLSFQKEQCLEIGMDDVIIKPIDLNKIQNVLLRYSKDRPVRHQAPCNLEFSACNTLCPHHLRTLDYETALARLGHDTILYVEICVDFLDKYNSEKFELMILNQPDAQAGIQEFVHTLKGSASSIGAERVAFLANYLQNNPAIDKALLHKMLECLHLEIKRVEAELDKLFTAGTFSLGL